MRIISLIASATEIVSALGLEDALVGRSHECDFPPAVRSLPACTRPRFEITGSSREIDQSVRSLLVESRAGDALSVYEVFPERLRELRPTHIVTQTQCDVCAVSLRDVERAVASLSGCDAAIISLQPDALADVWQDICRLASALGRTQAGVRLVADLQKRMEKIESQARALKSRPRFAAIEWVEPLMAAGNWMPELVRMAGGENLFGETGRHSPALQFEDLVEADPDVLFLAPCGFDMARAHAKICRFSKRSQAGAASAPSRAAGSMWQTATSISIVPGRAWSSRSRFSPS